MHEFFKLRVRPWGFLTAAGFLALLGSVAGFLGRHAWWLDIGSHFRVQYTILFAVLAACYLVGKKRGWTLACLVLAIVNFIPVATYRFPTKGYRLGRIHAQGQQGTDATTLHRPFHPRGRVCDRVYGLCLRDKVYRPLLSRLSHYLVDIRPLTK